MRPVLVTPPAGPVVSLADLKAELRVDFNDDDARIAALEKAAVAWLDGWGGILGRCILPQAWAVSYDVAGTHCLPLPDVTAVVATDSKGGSVECELSEDGIHVTLAAPARVVMTAALPDDKLDMARHVVARLVSAAYYPRGEADPTADGLPPMVAAMISALRRQPVI